MEITIRGKDYRVTEAVEDFAAKKLHRLARYLPNILDVHAELMRQHTRSGDDLSTVQITIRHKRGAILRAEESVNGDNMEGALTLALENMYRRIERFKGKQSRKGKTRFSLSLEELELAEDAPEADTDSAVSPTPYEDDIDYPAEIIRRKLVAVTALNEQEAVEQMELLGHAFYMFINDETKAVNVVYKRRSGGYGVLVPNLA
ncbi:MAG: ribosome-associated translation inhibitor RaiA [bacterium]|nr:ribosome-associated translation inhibitor RaiA [bacterium]